MRPIVVELGLIGTYWPQISACVALIVWFTRLESLTRSNSRDLLRLEKLRGDDLTAAADARASTNSKLDKIDDRMERTFAEFRADIKTLIRQKG